MYTENWDLEEINRLERLRERNVLRRRMLEQQAINSDPATFDSWADQIDACDEESKRLMLAILKAKGI